MRKWITSVVALTTVSWAGDAVCIPYFELNNLGAEYSNSTLKLFKNKMEELGKVSVLISSDTSRNASKSLTSNIEWARENQCSHLMVGSLTRLGESVSFNVKYLNTASSAAVFQKSYRASGPEDLDPILSQLAAKISDPNYASVESIYDVSAADARTLRKKRSSTFYGASIGGAKYTQDINLYQVSGLALWDNRSFIGEIEYQIGFGGGSVSQASNFLALRVYKPLSDNSSSMYYGGGLGFGAIVTGEYDYSSHYNAQTSSWEYSNTEPDEAVGMLATGSVGYMVGRTTDFRIRGQMDLNVLTTTFNTNKTVPIGVGGKLIVEFGN